MVSIKLSSQHQTIQICLDDCDNVINIKILSISQTILHTTHRHRFFDYVHNLAYNNIILSYIYICYR